MKKIVIVIKWVSHYRAPFYEVLRQELRLEDIELILVYGEPVADSDRRKKDWVDIDWAIKVRNVGIGLNHSLIWQSALPYIKDAELVVVEQANKLILNYWLQFQRLFGNVQLAYWGHGRNFQVSPSFLGKMKERWKELLLNQVNWWFAYTDSCSLDIQLKGFPKESITSVMNAVDTNQLKKEAASITDGDILAFKHKYRVQGSNVAVFCGGMFKEKRLGFLLQATMLIKEKVPDFEFIFIGAGVDQWLVEDAAAQYPWIHYCGALFGRDKVIAMQSAQVYVMPGLIGLGVLDAFSLELPVLTTNYEFHSPEIDYVENEVNGMITENTVQAFAEQTITLLLDHHKINKFKEGCRVSSKKYTVENMAKNFARGVVECLGG